ncbi:MAG: hypothetical protein ACTSX6_04810 [Candidatus Heimdallarchaeaceae archaeon]
MAISSSARVTASTLSSQSFANIYNLINDRNNVPDPNDSTGTRKFVYTSMPDVRSSAFQGYPFIVVQRTKPKKRKGSADLSKSMIDYDVNILVYAKDIGGDSSGNKTAVAQNETISNSIMSTLNSAANQKALLNYGMKDLEFNMDVDDDVDEEGKTVFLTEFDIRFVNNLTAT